MKKQIIFAATIALLLIGIFACQKDLAIDTPSVSHDLKSQNASNTITEQGIANLIGDEIFYSNQPQERGVAGPGFWFPGYVGFNDCNKPNGLCLLLQTFGGGRIPTWKGRLIDREHIRLESIVEVVTEDVLIGIQNDIRNGNIWTSDPSVELNNEFAERLADFVTNHFNIPKYIPFETEINNRFVEIGGFPSGTQLYTVPDEYKITRDAEHPNGYFDIKIYVQEPNGPPVPYSDCYWIGTGVNRRWICR